MEKVDTVIQKAKRSRSLPVPIVRRAIREQAGLSQQDIAEAIGTTRAAISRWELGERKPRPGNAGDAYFALLERLQREVLAQ